LILKEDSHNTSEGSTKTFTLAPAVHKHTLSATDASSLDILEQPTPWDSITNINFSADFCWTIFA